MEFTSQIGQDEWVLEMLKYKEAGVFVEIGAGDGKSLSNTYTLEKLFDWSGLCIEPSRQFANLQINRTCQVEDHPIFDKDGEEVIYVEDSSKGTKNSLSGIKSQIDTHKVKGKELLKKTKTLATVLTEKKMPQKIDYISIDTEGSEFTILKNFPFSAWDIKLITVEHNYIEPKRTQIYQLLTQNGFIRDRITDSQWDDFYYHESLATSEEFRLRRMEELAHNMRAHVNQRSLMWRTKNIIKRLIGMRIE